MEGVIALSSDSPFHIHGLLASSAPLGSPAIRRLLFDSNRAFSAIAIHAVTSLVINLKALVELSLVDLQLDSEGPPLLFWGEGRRRRRTNEPDRSVPCFECYLHLLIMC